MKIFKYHKQEGAVLIIALVMLLVLTLLATSSMRSTALDARITGNHQHTVSQLNMANAALREGEFRLFDSSYREDKLQYVAANCSIENTLKSYFNKPCLVDTSKIDIDKYFIQPITELGNATGGSENLKWMPYRGLDPKKEFKKGEKTPQGYWNANYMYTTETNPESILSGEGTHYFLVTGQAENEVAVQSTVRAVYLGQN